MAEIPLIDIDVSFDTKESIAHKNEIINQIIRNIPLDNDRYCIEHEEGSDTFKILEDPQQKEKDNLFRLILNTEKKLSRLDNKGEKVELKCIKAKLFNCWKI